MANEEKAKFGLIVLFIVAVVAVQVVKALVLNFPETAKVF